MSIRTNLIEEQYVQFSFLSEGQKRLIYSETLEVLQYTGAKVHHQEVCNLLQENGCVVHGRHVYIPSQLVNKALQSVPPVTTIHYWDGSGRLRIEQDRTYFGPGPTCPYFVDPHSGERRKYTLEDAALVARVCHALPKIGFLMSLGTISDVSDGLEEVYEFAQMIQNSSKPIIGWCYSREHCRDLHRIAISMAGGEQELWHRPIYIFYNEPISPLTCDFNAIDKLVYCAQNGIPQIFAPANTAGATVPATHAGHLVVSLAEALIGVVVSQLVNPGACIIIGGTQSILDMRRMVFSYGAPELSILGAGLSEMAEYIGLPVFTAGGCSDSNDLDMQAGIEAALSLHSAMLSKANLVHDVGFLESGMLGSLHQLVVSNEIIGMSRRINNGVHVNEETLACKEIDELFQQGSLEHSPQERKWRSLFWHPRLMNRQSREEWERQGAKSLKTRLVEYTRELTSEARGTKDKVPQSVSREIQEILATAEKRKKAQAL